MVLLTSSAISVAISSGIVCLFTFLLFLSGYVLQQQTVKSLQEALQAPIELRVRVHQELSTNYGGGEDVLLAVAEGNHVATEDVEIPGQVTKSTDQTVQIVLDGAIQQVPKSSGDVQQELSLQQLWHAHIDKSSDPLPTASTQTTTKAPPSTANSQNLDMRLAYVFSLPNLSDLCSGLLFTKLHRQNSLYPPSQFNIIYLYPSSWETSSNPIYKTALSLLIESEHKYSVLLHPVQISKVWTGIDVESQLLSELARNPWAYDRVMYLRSPGMLIDAARLDQTMVASYVTPRIVKDEWTKLRAPVRRGLAMSVRPDILLFAQGRGLMVPVSEGAKRVTARVRTRYEDGELDVGRREELSRDAAYVTFEEDELREKRMEKTGLDDISHVFEKEREAVCGGSQLLS